MNNFVPSIEHFEHKVDKVWKKMEKYDKATLIKHYVIQIDPADLERFHHEIKAYIPQISANDHHIYTSLSLYIPLITLLATLFVLQKEIYKLSDSASGLLFLVISFLAIFLSFILYKSHTIFRLAKIYCFNFLEQELSARISSLHQSNSN